MVTVSQITPIPISQLTDASTLTGDEATAIVQGGQTVQVPVNQLPQGMTAGVVTFGNTGGSPFPNYRTLKAGDSITITDAGPQSDLTISLTSGGSGAPSSAPYVVMSSVASLSAERVLAVGSALSLTDGGANGNATIGTQALTGAVTSSANSFVTTLSSGIDAAKIADGSVSSTEFQYLDGVTSSIQTQLNGKQASGTYVTSITVSSSNGFTGNSSGGATPALTLGTSINGVLKGNGTAISAAAAGTDYVIPAGNVATATALQNARTIGGVSFDGTANIVPQTIQSINEASDTTCFPLFITASGSQSLQTCNNTSLTFNASTGAFGATSFSGAGTGLTGTAASLTAGSVTTNANLSGVITSSGNVTSITSQSGTGTTFVVTNSPTLVTPTLGVAAATSINKVNITSVGTSATLTILNGKTLTANNSLTLAGTDSTTITFQGTDTYVGRTTTDTLTNKTFDTAGTGNSFLINGLAAVTNTGTGSVVRASSPTLVTPVLGTPASGVLTNCTGTASGLTAGTVTTNANLTGPITSVGNATSIASQTGTGTTFVMSASPTITGTLTGATLSFSNGTIANVIAATTSAASQALTIRNDSSTTGSCYGTVVNFSSAAPNDTTRFFISCSDSSTTRMTVLSNGNLVNTNNSYGAISDEKVKQDIIPTTSQWDDVKALAASAKKYRLISDVEEDKNAKYHLGAIAQEWQKISPGLVDKNEDTGLLSINYSIAYMKGFIALGELLSWADSIKAKLAKG